MFTITEMDIIDSAIKNLHGENSTDKELRKLRKKIDSLLNFMHEHNVNEV